MATIYTVQQGDTLSSIAWRHGFADAHALHDHPDNAELKRNRPDPNILYPGDRVSIPDHDKRQLACATGRTHRFTAQRPRMTLRLALREGGEYAAGDGAPIAGKRYKLEVGGDVYQGNIRDDGVLEISVPGDCAEARLTLWVRGDPSGPGKVQVLRIGHLDPLEEVSGVQARLQNLAFYEGPIDGQRSAALDAAILCFQKKRGLDVTGEIGDTLRNELRRLHGA